MTRNYRMNHPYSFASCRQVTSQRPLPTARGFLQTICEHPIYHEIKTEAEARAWLDAQRPRVQAQVPSPKVTTKSP